MTLPEGRLVRLWGTKTPIEATKSIDTEYDGAESDMKVMHLVVTAMAAAATVTVMAMVTGMAAAATVMVTVTVMVSVAV